MARFFTHLAYKGTNYHGWQFQSNAITVQETLNDAFSVILKEKIGITGAGRTDTGVHASNYYAHFDSENIQSGNSSKIIYQLNSYLPEDIIIKGIYKMHNKAHARFDAMKRTYKYYISNKKEIFQGDYCWQYFPKLNVELMNKAAKKLYDFNDFTSFSKVHTDVKTNICKVVLANWKYEKQMLVFTIEADRFLRNMVRSIVGTLIEVGLMKIKVNDFVNIIEKKDRKEAGTSVPAKGLFLENIEYPYLIR